jgi:hypothetical protein
MDPSDLRWKDIFSEVDLAEIKRFNLQPLPNLPNETQQFINTFKNITSIEELLKKVNLTTIDPIKNPSDKWVQDSFYNCIKLFLSNYFPLSDQTEGDLLRRVWQCLDTVFDDSEINSRWYLVYFI